MVFLPSTKFLLASKIPSPISSERLSPALSTA
jgi:hypothetical protein